MREAQTYLVDSDVFITAKNLYYAFDICPGFWKSVVHHHLEGRVFSVDRVRSELLAGRIVRKNYASHVVALRKRYWLLSLPVQLWLVE